MSSDGFGSEGEEAISFGDDAYFGPESDARPHKFERGHGSQSSFVEQLSRARHGLRAARAHAVSMYAKHGTENSLTSLDLDNPQHTYQGLYSPDEIDRIIKEQNPHPLSVTTGLRTVAKEFGQGVARRKCVQETQGSKLTTLNLEGREDVFNPPKAPSTLFKTVGTLGGIKCAIGLSCPTDMLHDVVKMQWDTHPPAIRYTEPASTKTASESPSPVAEETPASEEFLDRRKRQGTPVKHARLARSMPPDESIPQDDDTPRHYAGRLHDAAGNPRTLVVKANAFR